MDTKRTKTGGRVAGSKNLTPVDRLIASAATYAALLSDPKTFSALLAEGSLEKLEKVEAQLSEAQQAAQRLLEASAPRLASMLAEFEREKQIRDMQSEIEAKNAEIEALKKQLKLTGNGERAAKVSKAS